MVFSVPGNNILNIPPEVKGPQSPIIFNGL